MFFTVSNNDEDGHLSVPITSISLTNHNLSSQNHAEHVFGIQFTAKIFNHSIAIVRYITLFMFIRFDIKYYDDGVPLSITHPHLALMLTNQNTMLTISQESNIIASQIAAYLSIFIPFLYLFSSPAEVIIMKPA